LGREEGFIEERRVEETRGHAVEGGSKRPRPSLLSPSLSLCVQHRSLPYGTSSYVALTIILAHQGPKTRKITPKSHPLGPHRNIRMETDPGEVLVHGGDRIGLLDYLDQLTDPRGAEDVPACSRPPPP